MSEPHTEKFENMEDISRSEQEICVPLLHIYTFGSFQLRWQVPTCHEETMWNSRTSARALFKLLLCAPERQATKSVLAGILWPDTDEEKARESLRSACKVLRKTLLPLDREELLVQRNNGDILGLADQTRLWIDADAFDERVAQASRASSPETALTLWEEARALVRGEFLAEDQGTEWIKHPFVKKRRQGLWLARCRMIRHLADLYLQQGQVSLAEETLEEHLVRFPTDQDALYRLLLILEQQGYFEQASILYERTRRTLGMQGKQLAPHVRGLYERFQQSVSSRELLIPARRDTVSPATMPIQEKSSRFDASDAIPARAANGSRRGWMDTMHETLSFLRTDGRSESTIDILHVLLEPVGEETQGMAQLSRRQLLELGIAALLSRLAQIDGYRITGVDREELGWVLGKGIADGWKLFLTSSNAEILAVGQFQLSLIHQVHPLLDTSTRSYLYAGAFFPASCSQQMRSNSSMMVSSWR